MTKIRYVDLPEGLHARAAVRRGRTVIYLRPGLTQAERREALRHAMRGAHMGAGPRLSAPGVAVAVAADRVTGTARAAASAVRSHPLGSALLATAIAGMFACYALLVSVSIEVLPASAGEVDAPLLAAHPVVGPAPRGGPSRGPVAGTLAPGSAGGGAPGSAAGRRPPARRPSSSASLSRPPSPAPSPTGRKPSPSGGSPTSPAPTPSPTTSQLCVTLGPIGVCL